jgi:outer membrane lipoprotein-sorting protein
MILTLMLFSSFASADPGAVLERMRVRQTELKSLRADLEQTKSYPQLGIEDPAERGHIYVERRGKSSRVRIEIETPEPRILTVKDESFVLYQPRIRQAVEGKVTSGGKAGLFAGVMTGSAVALEELERSYSLEGLGSIAIGDRAAHHLRFTALPGVEVHCQRIELFVDDRLLLPIRQTCQEANQSVITFSLSGVETNVPLDQELFEVDIPSGVERVKG